MPSYISGPYTQGQLLKNIVEAETALTNRFLRGGAITDTVEQRDWQYRIEDLSFGRNTVMFGTGAGAVGYPAVMVRFPAISMATLGFGWPNQVHPAFVVNGQVKPEIWIAKFKSVYVGTTVGTDASVVSLRGLDPGNSKNWTDAFNYHKAMGAGFHLQTLIEHVLVAQLCKKQGFWPRGNNYYGKDISVQSEVGNPTLNYDTSNVGRTATGSGPLSWYHDGTPFGLADVNGNVLEWVGGMRLVDGEIQILENNNGADNTVDQSDTSAAWRAILQDGSLVDPGTANTLKIDSSNPLTNDSVTQNQGAPILRTSLVNGADSTWGWGNGNYDYNYCVFQNFTADVGVTVPDILKQYGLFPIDSDHGGDGLWVRNYGVRRPLVGGAWAYGSNAGVCSLALHNPASAVAWHFGARLAFVS